MPDIVGAAWIYVADSECVDGVTYAHLWRVEVAAGRAGCPCLRQVARALQRPARGSGVEAPLQDLGRAAGACLRPPVLIQSLCHCCLSLSRVFLLMLAGGLAACLAGSCHRLVQVLGCGCGRMRGVDCIPMVCAAPEGRCIAAGMRQPCGRNAVAA